VADVGEVNGQLRPPNRYRALWRLRSYLRPYLPQILVMALSAFVGVAASTLIPLVIEAMVDGPIQRGERAELLPLFGLALLLGVAEAGFIALRRGVQSVTVLQIEREARGDLYDHLQRLPVAFHDQWQTGQLLSRATTDLSTIRRFLGFGAIYLVANTLQYAAVLGLLIATYWPLGVVVAVATVPVIVVARRFGSTYALRTRRVQDLQGDLGTAAEEAASGIRVAKAFGRGPLLAARFSQLADDTRDASLGMVAATSNFWALLQFIPNLTMAVVVGGGAVAVAHGSLTLGGLVAFTTLLVLLQWPVIDIGWILAMAEESATAAVRFYEVLDTVPSIRDAPGATPLVHGRGRLAFEGVGFRYPDAARDILHDVDLVLEPGETLAIVGATGSGKSTLTALPSRLYDATAGRITLDGRDVRDVTLSSLRRSVATAFEDPVLFSMSVRENLTLGRPNARELEVEEALALAQADFVHELPWGLDTRIGEQGLSLSGGQRQRLALARAVLARPSVLVLDDPLSALDVQTEALVEEALARVLGDTTALLVVHRPSTVALADRVALLQDGTITAVGTHSELLRIPAYAEILAVDDVELAS
jgi:ATP-binding cassette subfamily B protein